MSKTEPNAEPEQSMSKTPNPALNSTFQAIAEINTQTSDPVNLSDTGDRAESTQVRLRICYWHPTADLLVFSALNYAENPPQDQHQLLENILKSVNKLGTMLTEPEFMDWPLTANASSDKEAACAMFATFLQGRLKLSGAKNVLLFGTRASHFLLPKTLQLTNNVGTLAGDIFVRTVPSLKALLADSANKRLTWQVIRPLLNSAF